MCAYTCRQKTVRKRESKCESKTERGEKVIAEGEGVREREGVGVGETERDRVGRERKNIYSHTGPLCFVIRLIYVCVCVCVCVYPY